PDSRFDAADDARAATVGDRRRARVRAPLEQLAQLALVARKRDDVAAVVEAAPKGAHDIRVGLAVGVACTFIGIARADVGERCRRRQARRRQLDLVLGHRQLDLLGPEAQVAPDAFACAPELGRRRLLVLVTPAPELAPAPGGY